MEIVTSLHFCRLHLLLRICHVIADYCYRNSVFLWYHVILAVSHLLLSKAYRTSCLSLTAPPSADDSSSQEQRHRNGRCSTALQREAIPVRWITFTEPCTYSFMLYGTLCTCVDPIERVAYTCSLTTRQHRTNSGE